MEFREQRGTTFEEAERRYAELKRRHDAGQIDDEQFDAERQGLLVVDDEGKWWAKSRESGQWLYHDGSAWIEATPPVYRGVSLEKSPARIERGSLEQLERRPAVRPPGNRSGLLIGLGVLCAVLAVGLIAALAYSWQSGSETANMSKPTNEKKEEKKDEAKPKVEAKSGTESKPKTETKSKATTPGASDSKVSASEEVETAVRDHYDAIGAGDFERAYSYFGPTFRSTNTEEGWVDNERTNQIRGSTVNDVNVETVSGSTATAAVDVSFRDKTGSPRFVLTWDLVREDGGWKLDSQTSGQKVN